MRRGLAFLAVAGALAALPPSVGAAPKKQRLHAFASCSTFVHYARRHAINELTTRGVPVPRPIFSPGVRMPQQQTDATAPQAESTPTAGGGAGQDFSTTNVQEAGVDEPDTVKTDGKTVFVASNGRLFAVDARSNPPKLLGSIALDGYGQELLLDGDRLLVLSGAPIVYAIDALPPQPAQGAPTKTARSSIV
ncbi:MAG: hypothetical protein QOH13_735, partial [Thermoleophilaceae bacterium]|nr:hypothetical protein [Thermoleophilaceae bacterium]